MRRTFEFNSSHGAGEKMAKILEIYANAAYPLGGSECAAASREALQHIAKNLISSDYVSISTRQRPMLKSALKWFYSESNKLLDDTISEDKMNSNIISLDQEMYENLLSQLQR